MYDMIDTTAIISGADDRFGSKAVDVPRL
jgi:hypothetical protein